MNDVKHIRQLSRRQLRKFLRFKNAGAEVVFNEKRSCVEVLPPMRAEVGYRTWQFFWPAAIDYENNLKSIFAHMSYNPMAF